jgi:hypothetical protein
MFSQRLDGLRENMRDVKTRLGHFEEQYALSRRLDRIDERLHEWSAVWNCSSRMLYENFSRSYAESKTSFMAASEAFN